MVNFYDLKFENFACFLHKTFKVSGEICGKYINVVCCVGRVEIQIEI